MADRDTRSARELARVLDTGFTIPGTRIRFGLDAILGLIPGGGDLAGAALSSVIVLMAMRQGVPSAVLWRMVGNVAIDTAIGTVPVLGDIFDFVWKSNSKNAELLERYVQEPGAVTKRSRWVGILVVTALLLVLVGIGTLGFLLTRAIWRLLTA